MKNKDKRIASSYLLFSMTIQSLLPGKFRFSEGLPRQEVIATGKMRCVHGIGKLGRWHDYG
jgi:hypothetical protein